MAARPVRPRPRFGYVTLEHLYFRSASAPGAGDDANDGHYPGRRWLDDTNQKIYECIDASPGAALWKQSAGAGQQIHDGDFHVDSDTLLLGRYSAGSGAVQKITIGSGLSLSGTGLLSATGVGGNPASDLSAALAPVWDVCRPYFSSSTFLVNGVLFIQAQFSSAIISNVVLGNPKGPATEANTNNSQSFNRAGLQISTSLRRRYNGRSIQKFSLRTLTDVRLFVGLTADNILSITSSDDPSGQNRVGLSFSTSRSDSNWQFTCKNYAGSEVLQDSGVAVSTDLLHFQVELDDSTPSAKVTLFDEDLAQLATHTFTTGLPGQDDTLTVLMISLNALGNGTKTVHIFGAAAASDY